jgi:hypothetical protein
MDRLQREGEGQARGLVPMDEGGSEGQARGLGAEGPKQRWRASKAKVDELEVYVMVWVIHITYDDQAKWFMCISSGLVKMSVTPFLRVSFMCEFG